MHVRAAIISVYSVHVPISAVLWYVIYVQDFDPGQNMEFCYKCLDYGELLLCDGCPRSFHIQCLGMSAVPDCSPWNCYKCIEAKRIRAAEDALSEVQRQERDAIVS